MKAPEEAILMRFTETTPAFCEKNQNLSRNRLRYDQIHPAITVQISETQGNRRRNRENFSARKQPISIPVKNRHLARPGLGTDHIQGAVPVHITHYHPTGPAANLNGYRPGNPTLSVSEQYANLLPGGCRNDNVQVSVLVDIRENQGMGRSANVEMPFSLVRQDIPGGDGQEGGNRHGKRNISKQAGPKIFETSKFAARDGKKTPKIPETTDFAAGDGLEPTAIFFDFYHLRDSVPRIGDRR
jgi:hypothetical protein